MVFGGKGSGRGIVGGALGRLRQGLSKTRQGLIGRLEGLFSRGARMDMETLEELEELLLAADLGVKVTTSLVDEVERGVRRGPGDLERLKEVLREKLLEILSPREGPLNVRPERPFVILTVGVNGVGKTTTIAKMARRFIDQALEVILVAADTFRAAGIEQLEIWGKRVGAEVIKQQLGADPSAVVFDALRAARARGTDVVIIDTAGRLHTKVNLMDELKKVRRVCGKVIEDSPHEVLLILDATTGQNALSQARMFHDALGVTGIALTKLDGTAKGGIIVAISSELEIPLRYIGVGEKVEDLLEFQAGPFVEALL